MKVFLWGCEGVPVGAGCTARKIVDIIMPKDAINVPIVRPSRLNSSLNLSKRGLVSSFEYRGESSAGRN